MCQQTKIKIRIKIQTTQLRVSPLTRSLRGDVQVKVTLQTTEGVRAVTGGSLCLPPISNTTNKTQSARVALSGI
jgi:hypothetical protein